MYQAALMGCLGQGLRHADCKCPKLPMLPCVHVWPHAHKQGHATGMPAGGPCLLLMAVMLPQTSSCTQLCMQGCPASKVMLCTLCRWGSRAHTA